MVLLEDRPRLLQCLHGAYCEVQLRGLCEDRTAVRNTFKMILGIVRIQEKIKNGNKWEIPGESYKHDNEFIWFCTVCEKVWPFGSIHPFGI